MKLYPIYINYDGDVNTLINVLANNEEEILSRLDSEYLYGSWSDNYNDYEHEGYDSYYEYMLGIRGEINDEQVMNDALEGTKQYGWDEGVEITQEEADVMLKFSVIEDWRTKE